VDHCFATGENGLGGTVEHLAFHEQMPGRVDLWPMIAPAGKPEDGEWDEPLDRPSEQNHEIALAQAVADEIRAMIDRGERIEAEGVARQVHEGDFLILVRRRKLLFNEIIRACKARGLEIAGADRLVLSEELAVQDLIALLRFLALPEDDLSLAITLRSPLFGWTEDQLFRLAQGRGQQFLWERLRAGGGETVSVLADLRSQIDFLRPYELIERILTRHDGRRRLMARFGAEAEDAIEAFVALALQYEQGRIPSLDGFLGWLTASDAEIKRQSEGAGRRIRVMTVHGAKGLEAPIVILPDTAERRAPAAMGLSAVRGVPVLRMNKPDAPPAQLDADQEAASQRAEESDRLLYVALTRAERWLIVAGAGEAGDGWYDRVSRGLGSVGAVPCEFPTGRGVRFQHGIWPAPAVGGAAAVAPSPERGDVKALFAPLPAMPVEAGVLSPSLLGGAKALPGEAGAEEAVALRRGQMVHLLLEHLPGLAPELHKSEGRRHLTLLAAAPEEADLCLGEVLALMSLDTMAPLLAPDALSEVSLSGEWNGRRMSGTIDRLLITPGRVLAVDFKTNRVVPGDVTQVPEGLLRQMGAYAHLLQALYPDRAIETALVWTATSQVMPIPGPDAAAALARAALDPALGGS
jgi:ATP-dependent helicase/nuclease subunit A